MPALETAKQDAQQQKPADPQQQQQQQQQGQAGDGTLEQKVDGMDYAQGAQQVSPDGQKTAAKGDGQEAAKQDAERKKKFEKALGGLIGGPLFDLINEHLSTDALNGYAKDGLGELAGLAKGVKPTDKGALGGAMDEASEAAAAKQLAEALLKWAQESAEAWLQTPKGQAFLAKINQYVEEHPWVMASTAVAGAIIGAVVLVTQNYDPKMFDTQFGLGKGLKLSAGVDIGPIQSLTIEGAKLGLALQRDRFGASAGATWKQDKKDGQTTNTVGVEAGATLKGDQDGEQHKLGANAQLSDKGDKGVGVSYDYTSGKAQKGQPPPTTVHADANVKTDATGNLVVDAKAAFDKPGLKLEGSTGGASINEQVSKAKVTFGEPGNTVAVDGKYQHSDGTFTLGLTKGLEQDGMKLQQRLGTDGQAMDLSYGKGGTQGQLGMKQDEQGKTTGSAGVETKQDGWTVGSTAELDLDNHEVQKVAVKLGHSDASGANAFLLEYAREWSDKGLPKDAFKAMLKKSIGALQLGADVGAQMEGGKVAAANLGVSVGNASVRAALDLEMKRNGADAFDVKGSLALGSGKSFNGLKLDYARELDPNSDRYKSSVGVMGETQLGNLGLRGSVGASTMDGHQWDARAELMGAYPVNDRLKLLGGMKYDQTNGDGAFTGMAGVQVGKVPVVVSYTPERKEVSVGVTIGFDKISSLFK